MNKKELKNLFFGLIILAFFLSPVSQVKIKKGLSQSDFGERLELNSVLADCDKWCQAQIDLDNAWKKLLGTIQIPGTTIIVPSPVTELALSLIESDGSSSGSSSGSSGQGAGPSVPTSSLPSGGTVPGIVPFGGTVLATFPCPCNASMVFTILPVAGPAGPYIVNLAHLKQFGNLSPGNWTLGSALPVSTPCLTVFLCLPIPVPLTVNPLTGVGTSLTP